MNIKNSLLGTALVMGLSVGQNSSLDEKIIHRGNNISDSVLNAETNPNLRTSSLILETKKSVSEKIEKPKNCETDDFINLFDAFENACKKDEK